MRLATSADQIVREPRADVRSPERYASKVMATERINRRPAGRQGDAAAAEFHQAIRLQVLEPPQFVRKIAVKSNAVAPLDRGHVHAAVAHDRLNDIPAHHVVPRSCARRDSTGSTPHGDRSLVVAERFVSSART
jgi:hypothetical protein